MRRKQGHHDCGRSPDIPQKASGAVDRPIYRPIGKWKDVYSWYGGQHHNSIYMHSRVREIPRTELQSGRKFDQVICLFEKLNREERADMQVLLDLLQGSVIRKFSGGTIDICFLKLLIPIVYELRNTIL